MAGLCEGGNEPPGSLKAKTANSVAHCGHVESHPAAIRTSLHVPAGHENCHNAVDAVSTAPLFSVNEFGNSEIVFGEMRLRIRLEYLTFALRMGKT
ncbi:hypothetical protein ANN_00750 [Periplaneta americana]|uniref:Per a allergen n=1 Tax=Periplaneta americana TaxID=6978 RepID=A0ABQ8TRR0_PERAM|nr:hypothetical protein ANN_00750 [Periplaneta americana]